MTIIGDDKLVHANLLQKVEEIWPQFQLRCLPSIVYENRLLSIDSKEVSALFSSPHISFGSRRLPPALFPPSSPSLPHRVFAVLQVEVLQVFLCVFPNILLCSIGDPRVLPRKAHGGSVRSALRVFH